MAENKDIAVRNEESPERVSRRPAVTPAVDIYENKNEVVVLFDLPGVTQDGLQVNFEKDELHIEARATELDGSWTPLFREFAPRDYRRAFQLAPGIDVGKISAELRAGVLTIKLPKAEALKPRRIAVKSE